MRVVVSLEQFLSHTYSSSCCFLALVWVLSMTCSAAWKSPQRNLCFGTCSTSFSDLGVCRAPYHFPHTLSLRWHHLVCGVQLYPGMGPLEREGCLRGTFVNCVHGQGQKSLSLRSHNLPPSQSLTGFSWSVIAHAVVPQGTPTISADFSELRGGKGGWFFSPGVKKMPAREKLLNRRSISGKGREEACVAGGRLGLRHFGFPEAVGCGKHCG